MGAALPHYSLTHRIKIIDVKHVTKTDQFNKFLSLISEAWLAQ